jgi:hypothetical protein
LISKTRQAILIVVVPCILISSKRFYQQMHSLLKHKMLQLTLKISLYMTPTCFGPLRPLSGSTRRNVAKVTVFVEIISKNTSLTLLLCSGNMCFSLYSSVCTGCYSLHLKCQFIWLLHVSVHSDHYQGAYDGTLLKLQSL